MGFVTSASTITLEAHLTQLGRELLLLGLPNVVTKFSLGDSDSNYFTEIPLSVGVVPDITGDYGDSLISLAKGISIKYPIPFRDEEVIKNNRVAFVVDDVTYNNLSVEVDLGNIAAFMLANTTTEASPSLENPFVNFFESIIIEEIEDEIMVGKFVEEIYFEFPTAIDAEIYKQITGEATLLYDSINKFSFLPKEQRELTSSYLVKSPLQLAFSSKFYNDGYVPGAGSGGVIINGREYGYLITSTNRADENLASFVSADRLEGTEEISLPQGLGLVSPCAKYTPYNGITYYWLANTTVEEYNDTTGAHDHLKRFNGLDYFTNAVYLIDSEVETLQQWFAYMTQLGYGTENGTVRRVELNLLAKPLQTSVNKSASAGNLTLILKMDSDDTNWNASGAFITIN